MSWVPYIPNFFVILLGIIIALVVYHYLPDDIKQPVKKALFNYWIYLVLLIVVIYFWNDWGYVRDYNSIGGIRMVLFCTGLVLLIYGIVINFFWRERYHTNHFIADNISGSCHRFQEVTGIDGKTTWVVFFLGTSGTSDEKFVVPLPWPKKLCVVPKCACQFLGNQIMARSHVNKVDLFDLDEEVRHFIETDHFGKGCVDEIYMGLWDIKVLAANPELKTIQADMIKKDARINELVDMLKGKLTTAKTWLNDTMAMSDKLKGKEWRSSGQKEQREE